MLMKTKINNIISDIVADFLYYDRKEDDELRPGDIEKAIINKEITIYTIVANFRLYLEEAVDNYEINYEES